MSSIGLAALVGFWLASGSIAYLLDRDTPRGALACLGLAYVLLTYAGFMVGLFFQ